MQPRQSNKRHGRGLQRHGAANAPSGDSLSFVAGPITPTHSHSLPLTPTHPHSLPLTPTHPHSTPLTPTQPHSPPLTPAHSHPLLLQATIALLSQRQRSLPPLKVSETSDTLATAPLVRDIEAKERQAATSLGAPISQPDPKAPEHRLFFVDSAAGGALSSAAGHHSHHGINTIQYHTIPCHTLPSSVTTGAAVLGGGFKWQVSLQAFREKDWRRACGCGRTASAAAPLCKHIARVVMGTNAAADEWRKAWQVRYGAVMCIRALSHTL